MLKSLHMIAGFVLLPGLISAQSATRPKFPEHASIVHGDSVVTVFANDSIPLHQANSDLRLEYGWQINWESAPGYSHFDVVDDTDPGWRAGHPGEKGVTRPAGGSFIGTFPEPKDASDTVAERDVLARLIDEYNATENPGRYVLRVGKEGQLSVIGTRVKDETGALQKISPLLDTPVSIPAALRNVDETIRSILGALQSATGKKVIFAAASSSLFINTQVTMGSKGTPARDLLERALPSTKRPIQFDLSFDPDVPIYVLSVSPAMRLADDGRGGRKLVPVEGFTKP